MDNNLNQCSESESGFMHAHYTAVACNKETI